MDLNHILLKPLMLADLYGSQLIETERAAPPAAPTLNFLGKNKKNIVVLVDHDNAPILPDAELNFLTSILAACKLSLADIAIVNFHTADTALLKELMDQSARNVLLFDVSPLSIGLPINFPHFQVQSFNQRTYVCAPGLSAIEKDKGLKMQLWNGLKQLFGL